MMTYSYIFQTLIESVYIAATQKYPIKAPEIKYSSAVANGVW